MAKELTPQPTPAQSGAGVKGEAMNISEIMTKSLGELTDELAAGGYDSTMTCIHEARDAVAKMLNEYHDLGLYDYYTGERIADATDDQAAESARCPGGAFDLDGRTVFVAD